jgi:hypothetical protein
MVFSSHKPPIVHDLQ